MQINNENILSLQKKTVSYVTLNFLGSFALFLLMCVGLLSAGLNSKGSDRIIFLFVLLPMFLLPTTWFLVNCIRTFRILKQFMSIKEADLCEAQISCRKVRFLFNPKNRTPYRTQYKITVLMLLNEYGEEYCYIFPKGSEPLDRERELLRQHLEDKKITFFCYRNTNFIKSLDLPKGETV